MFDISAVSLFSKLLKILNQLFVFLKLTFTFSVNRISSIMLFVKNIGITKVLAISIFAFSLLPSVSQSIREKNMLIFLNEIGSRIFSADFFINNQVEILEGGGLSTFQLIMDYVNIFSSFIAIYYLFFFGKKILKFFGDPVNDFVMIAVLLIFFSLAEITYSLYVFKEIQILPFQGILNFLTYLLSFPNEFKVLMDYSNSKFIQKYI